MRNRPDALIRPTDYDTTAFVYSFHKTEINPLIKRVFSFSPATQFAGVPHGP